MNHKWAPFDQQNAPREGWNKRGEGGRGKFRNVRRIARSSYPSRVLVPLQSREIKTNSILTSKEGGANLLKRARRTDSITEILRNSPKSDVELRFFGKRLGQELGRHRDSRTHAWPRTLIHSPAPLHVSNPQLCRGPSRHEARGESRDREFASPYRSSLSTLRFSRLIDCNSLIT